MQLEQQLGADSLPKAAAGDSDEEYTTLVFKNLPADCTRRSFCDILDVAGFAGLYNFLYIPASFKSWKFFGYAFVNFELHEVAARCLCMFQNNTLLQEMSVQWCEEHQGLCVHIERYRNSPIMHSDINDEYKPIYLSHGHRLPFPAPTKVIRPPRTMPQMRA